MKSLLKVFFICLFLGAFSTMSCKKFLNVDSIIDQSGNNYWKSAEDADKYMLGIYAKFRGYTMQSNLLFFAGTGDFRCGPYMTNPKNSNRKYLNYLPANDLKALLADGNYSFGFVQITNWTSFYEIIAACNILIDKANEIPGLSQKQKDGFIGEAVFMRNLCYFIMARLFGDLPYTVKAYDRVPASREKMIDVINKCITDLSTVVDKLPWTYEDPAFKGIRAQRGGALILLMHMNMWNAGFDQPNKLQYYQAAYDLGTRLINNNEGNYELLPLDNYRQIFKGGSREGLFEIPQSLNKGEFFSLFSTYADNFLKFPHKRYVNSPGQPSECYTTFTGKFLDVMFPENKKSDRRRTLWFAQSDPNNMYTLECLKYVNIYGEEGEDVNPDDYQVLFRLADAILLQAEACDGLDKKAEAIQLLNIIRTRAGAPLYQEGETSGRTLGDAIWMERVIELIGEGQYFFDLVRTRRILDFKFTQHPISAEAFANGAWTWPIHESALTENPGMRLNEYWRR